MALTEGNRTIRDPYRLGILTKNPYVQKRNVLGELVAILDLKLEERGLKLIDPISRAFRMNEIHELIMTDEAGHASGRTIDRVAYLGFFEVKVGGVVTTNDKVLINGNAVGDVLGFDETHAPNHLNVVIKANERKTGVELGLELGHDIILGKL